MTQKLFIALVAGAAIGAGSSAQADLLSQWDFNSNPSDASTGTGVTTPAINITAPAGVLTNQGGITNSFGSGDASGGSTDPNVGDDSGYQTTAYPAQGTDSGTGGVGFSTSTTGWENIVVSWDQRFSNTSSRFYQFQYTLDVSAGTPTWVSFGAALENAAGGDMWINNNSINLSGETGVANNANFGFRIVSVFGPADAYVASNPTSTYAGTGTWRFDMVTVRGTEIPGPGALALLGLGGLIGLRRRRGMV
jgi:MYXO-CTERM domain-containing protein